MMNSYLAAYYTHVTCATLSITFFLVRGLWMFTANDLLQHRLVKVSPHIIDTILLLSAIVLTILIRQYPFLNGWLTAKVFALIAYIVLGTIALKRGRTLTTRAIAFAAAILSFGYIVSVAIYHHTLGIFVWLVY